MKTNKLTLLAVTFLMTITSCTKPEIVDNPVILPAPAGCPNAVHGTIEDLTGLDGCGLVIQLDNGDYLEVVAFADSSVEASFNQLVDGDEFTFSYSENYDFGTICMVGQTVTIECIDGTSSNVPNSAGNK